MATHSSIPAWENPMDRGAWRATVLGVTKSQTWFNNQTTTALSYSLSGTTSSCPRIQASTEQYGSARHV